MSIPCLRALPLSPSRVSYAFSASKRVPLARVKMSAAAPTTKRTIEHVVLFKSKESIEPSKLDGMINGLNGLVSLDQVLHLAAGPVTHSRSSASCALAFTHMLHSRYGSEDDLSAYSAHPDHMRVVRDSVLPACEDIMAVDWVAGDLDGPLVLPPGSAVRVTFLKLKENLGKEVKDKILGVLRGIKDKFGHILQLTCGENFSPARAKGFSIASLAVFPGPSELEAVCSQEDLVNLEKEKIREYLEGVIVVDYVVPPASQSASL